jgi:hypothetical protein
MVRRAAALILLLAAAAGCSAPGPAPAPATSAVTPVTSFNGTDTAWIQLMIPMTEQILAVLALGHRGTTDPRVAAAHRADLVRLTALRDRAGLSAVDVHEGHDMPGMMTPAEFAAARRDPRPALITGHLRAHLAQSVLLCDGERASGADPGTLAVAEQIRRSRAAQLARLGPGPAAGTPSPGPE